jgi:hypothetical protein
MVLPTVSLNGRRTPGMLYGFPIIIPVIMCYGGVSIVLRIAFQHESRSKKCVSEIGDAVLGVSLQQQQRRP